MSEPAPYDNPGLATARPSINPWFIAFTVTLATFMELLDTSIANVALPHIAGGLSTGIDESTWVLSSYLVSNAVVLPLSAWLSRVFGRKNYYMTCVVLFTVASLLCGLAPSLNWLIFFRVLQGVGGGGLAPCEQAILVDTFPPAKRAAAFALYSIAIVLAPAIGPTLGGWITDSFSWRWVFFINLPVGLISIFLTNKLVSDPPAFTAERAANKGKVGVDYIGIILIALAFGCLEVVLDKGEREDWLQSSFIVIFLSVALVSLITGIFWELRTKDPVVDLSLLSERNFTIACMFYFLFGFTLFGSTVLIPQMLQSLFGYTAMDAGLVISPGAMLIVVLVPLVVRGLRYVSPARMAGIGFFILAVATWHFSTLTLQADFKTIMFARMFQAFGLAFLFVPTSQIAYSFLPKSKNNKASSLTNLFRNLGGSFGIAFVTTMQARRQQYHRSVMTEHLTTDSPAVHASIKASTDLFYRAGAGLTEATQKAYALLNFRVQQQSNLLGYLDSFYLLSFFAILALCISFFVRPFGTKDTEGGGH